MSPRIKRIVNRVSPFQVLVVPPSSFQTTILYSPMQADVLGQNVISCFEFVDARLCMMHLDVAFSVCVLQDAALAHDIGGDRVSHHVEKVHRMHVLV